MAGTEVPEWDSWAADFAEANANSDKGKGKNKDNDQGKGKDKDNGLEKGKGKHKGKIQGEPTGWQGPYVDVLGRRYWTFRTYKTNGQSKTRRYTERDDDDDEDH